MQHGERGAQLPRNIAKQRGRELRNAHNSQDGWVSRLTGKPIDRANTFAVETKSLKRRPKKTE